MECKAVPNAADKPARLSGRALLEAMRDGDIVRAPMAATLDFALEVIEDGRVVFVGAPKDAFYNPHGSVHGGYAATLLDSAMGCAVHTLLEPGIGYTTLELKVNFVRPMTAGVGEVRAEGVVVHRGRRTATAEGRLVDANGRLYAHGSCTCLIVPLDGS
jgi:uncharacterized protein (TIGR00369 family)